MDLTKALAVCLEAVHDAGRLTLGYFARAPEPRFKEDGSPVTEADLRAEELIRSRLEQAFPDHGIQGEEHGLTNEGAGARWYVDPIDGTKSFMRGVPLYANLLALEVDGEVVVGAANFPALGEVVYAVRGGGAFLNGRPARVRDTEDLSQAMVAFTDAASFAKAGMAEGWQRLMAATFHRPGWSDAYGHACVATGRVEVMIDPLLAPHDAGPFGVILEEAGGWFGDLSGRPGIHGGSGMSSNLPLRDEVLDLMRPSVVRT
ncbi:MAG TPA: inositol monophosphatase family protein [Trueperaceae bacterium]|nr:inositol monophosphatase family protein [Trueperaceae bacterium]